MELSSYEDWMEWTVQDRERRAAAHATYVQIHPDYLKRRLERHDALNRKWSELLVDFPYSVVAEGDCSEQDYAGRWCWLNISPESGRCNNYHSTYPACPLVLATEFIEQGVGKDIYGTERTREWKAYRDPGEHRHEGDWKSLWLGKSGHDYGFNVFFFAKQSDHDQFLTAFPTFIWHSSWDSDGTTG
ncbi:MAG: hypothetical protein JWL77_4241 [Chthonomonadaceae bacterium]|nr:hypothetical protein [Chthonomonadaceae bacterium]